MPALKQRLSAAGPEVLRFIRFGVVGFSGVFINLGALWVIADLLSVQVDLASALAIEISIIWNFFLNNAWTFKDRNESAEGGFVARMVRYHVVTLVGAAVQWLTFFALTRWGFFVESVYAALHVVGIDKPGLEKYPAQMVGIGVAMVWNFLSNFYWTWAQKKEEPAPDDPSGQQRSISVDLPTAPR